MINAKNILKLAVASRYFYFKSYKGTCYTIYESMPEDGLEIRRKIGEVASERHAKAFVKIHRQKFLEYLESILSITDAASARDIEPPDIEKSLAECENIVLPELKTVNKSSKEPF